MTYAVEAAALWDRDAIRLSWFQTLVNDRAFSGLDGIQVGMWCWGAVLRAMRRKGVQLHVLSTTDDPTPRAWVATERLDGVPVVHQVHTYRRYRRQGAATALLAAVLPAEMPLVHSVSSVAFEALTASWARETVFLPWAWAGASGWDAHHEAGRTKDNQRRFIKAWKAIGGANSAVELGRST